MSLQLGEALRQFGIAQPDRTEVLESWGFPVPKTDHVSETNRALAQLFNQGV